MTVMNSRIPVVGTERTRDEQREGGGPRYGGQLWRVADERGAKRFGHARNDDANRSELVPAKADNQDDDSPAGTDLEIAAAEAAGEIAGSTEHAGMGRGDHPRATKSRDKG